MLHKAMRAPGSRWYVARLSASNPYTSNNFITKGPGFLDPRWSDGGTPVTYPGSGTSFALPLSPPYTSVTIVICGGSWAQFNTNGARPRGQLGVLACGRLCGGRKRREHACIRVDVFASMLKLHSMQCCRCCCSLARLQNSAHQCRLNLHVSKFLAPLSQELHIAFHVFQQQAPTQALVTKGADLQCFINAATASPAYPVVTQCIRQLGAS